jgi:hypothetical protein
LALTWIPLKNIKEEIKKNKNNNIKTRIGKRETRNERRDLTASLCVLIND